MLFLQQIIRYGLFITACRFVDRIAFSGVSGIVGCKTKNRIRMGFFDFRYLNALHRIDHLPAVRPLPQGERKWGCLGTILGILMLVGLAFFTLLVLAAAL